MSNIESIAQQLCTAFPQIIVSARPPREVRLTIARECIPPVAEYLNSSLNAQPELVLAEDNSEDSGSYTLRYLFEAKGQDVVVVASADVPKTDPTFPSLATDWYQASRFEREMHDMFGLTAVGNPDRRRLPLHQFWPSDYYPLQKDAVRPAKIADDGTAFPFHRVEGEGIFEITVGPVHAGIIEPGHFRFSVEGETIVNLESRLYYVHKGIEKQFETLPLSKSIDLAERISGDSSVAHAMAFCQAIESIAEVTIPPRAAVLRVVYLELERLYNHIADAGAICTDTGFAVANAHAMRLREQALRLNARLTRHRLLRGSLAPGGVVSDLSAAQADDARRTTVSMMADFDEVMVIALSNGLLLDRLHHTGRLTERTAREMQVVGVPARASGIDADTRRDHPYAAYGQFAPKISVFKEGDVWARLMVRVEEARESVRLIDCALANLPDGPLRVPLPPLSMGSCGFGLVEGWRGPIWHWVVAGGGDRLARVKVKDPSFSNWPALSYAILKNIVPDFPLVNKSFNLSYAGNDL